MEKFQHFPYIWLPHYREWGVGVGRVEERERGRERNRDSIFLLYGQVKILLIGNSDL